MEIPGSAPSAKAVPDAPELAEPATGAAREGAAREDTAPDSTAPEDTAPDSTAALVPADDLAARTGPVWRFLVEPRWLAWHVFVVLAVWLMLWLGDWQFHRAIAGNGLSWAYTFEWPLFAGFGIVFWARTIRDEYRERRGTDISAAQVEPSGPVLPAGIGTRVIDEPDDEADDTELASYNAYLARLHNEVKGHNKWLGSRGPR